MDAVALSGSHLPAPRLTGSGVPQPGAASGARFQGSSLAPAYLLQLGAPGELLHGQGEARAELQPASPDRQPEQHLDRKSVV